MRIQKEDRLIAARKLAKEARDLHLPGVPVMTYDISKNGKPYVSSKSESWVRNAINVMTQQMLLGIPRTRYAGNTNDGLFEDGSLCLTRLDGTVWNGDAYNWMGWHGSLDRTDQWDEGESYGLVVGSGTTGESYDDYALDAIIPHGSTAGSLSYSACSANLGVWDSVNEKWSVTVTRTFTNVSGSDITINEIGYYARYLETQDFDGSGDVLNGNGHMLIRDVLTTPVTLANGESTTISYTIEYAV